MLMSGGAESNIQGLIPRFSELKGVFSELKGEFSELKGLFSESEGEFSELSFS